MTLNRRRVTLAVVALGLAVGLTGGGIALAATGPSPTAGSAAIGAGMGRCGGWSGSTSGANSPMAAAAKYLGLTQAELREQMRSGTSLADIATSRGKTVRGLEDAMAAAMRRNLDSMVTATRPYGMPMGGMWR